MLDTIIKFDLHIHSKASDYKEGSGIVDNSTKENIPILLSKLNEQKVELFAITDHNRFDYNLYLTIDQLLKQPSNPYPNVKAILPGIEFDVMLDDTMDKCHIITIFDCKNDPKKLEQILNGLGKDSLEHPDEFYSKKRFENILESIGLNTILIASQHKDIHNHNGKHNSLSDSIDNVEEIIKLGYIDALEFQKPKVEGILINSLKDLSLPVPLLSGSDCHDWRCYPYHSENNRNLSFHHSKAKILPTFKGLLMAITSPETRFNCRANTNQSFCMGVSIQGQTIPLTNGINAIIGENGSGKTTLLELLNGKVSKAHVKKLVAENSLKVEGMIDPTKIKYIEQGEIIRKFNTQTLFTAGEDSNFKDLDHLSFRKAYSDYAQAIKQNIKALIEGQSKINALSNHSIAFENDMNATSYFVDVICHKNFEIVDNPHEGMLKEVNELIEKINVLLNQDYFQNYKSYLMKAREELTLIKNDIHKKFKATDFESKVKNIIYSCIKDYSRKIKQSSSTKDQEVKEYKEKKQSVIDSVVEAIKTSLGNSVWPPDPPIIQGVSKNLKRGFYFNSEASYNSIQMTDEFYSKMFIKQYDSIEKLQNINTWEKFSTSIRNCTSPSDVDTRWNDNLEKFLNEATKTKEYIMDSAEQQVGNTLGEMSLSYYKFFTEDGDTNEWNVLIIDQPEDNISNNNINQKLIRYFNAIRDIKQLIFVTHNPLLVVNLDVDNVIYIKNNTGNLSINNGCLEYEDEQTNILELVAQNMDGGKETIEKRLKVYGKNY